MDALTKHENPKAENCFTLGKQTNQAKYQALHLVFPSKAIYNQIQNRGKVDARRDKKMKFFDFR